MPARNRTDIPDTGYERTSLTEARHSRDIRSAAGHDHNFIWLTSPSAMRNAHVRIIGIALTVATDPKLVAVTVAEVLDGDNEVLRLYG